MVVETIGSFSRNGTEVFTSVMDMTKAFDNVKHSILFPKRCTCNIHTAFDGNVWESNCQCQMEWIIVIHIRNEKWGQERSSFISVVILCVRGWTL